MKKKILILTMVCMLGLTGCGQDEGQGRQETEPSKETEKLAETEDSAGIKISYEELSGASDESDKNYSYIYSYKIPTVEISGNQEAGAKIQEQINQKIDEFLANVNGGEFGVVFELEDGSQTEPSYQKLDWSVIRSDEQIISLCMTNEGYDKGAHGWYTVDYLNFYTETGEMVTFDSLGENFKEKSETLVLQKAGAMQALSDEMIFYDDYESIISLVIQDGTESANEVYQRLYGFELGGDNEEKMLPTFAVTQTGFIFTSGQYVLQPYAGGIIDFPVNVKEYEGDCRTDIFNMDKAAEEYEAIKEEAGKNKDILPITSADVESFVVDESTKKAVQEKFGSFDDNDKIMNQDFTGTWYNPEENTALRITPDYVYIYYPALNMYGERKYRWEMVDRSENGLCPMLATYEWDMDIPGPTYYIGGCEEKFFWCNMQQEIFYKQ